MYTVSHQRGTAPASLVVVQGIGRALNPTKRSGRPQNTNLSCHDYDKVTSHHRDGKTVNTFRTDAFDTPVAVFAKVTGWMTVSGGRHGLTVTYSPDSIVRFAEVEQTDPETGDIVTLSISDITLREYLDTYC